MYIANKTPQLAMPDVKKLPWKERFFFWPDQKEELLDYITRNWVDKETYFAPMLWKQRQRRKEGATFTPCAWSDLDSCEPSNSPLVPTITLNTSEGNWAAFWLFAEPVEPYDAEQLSLRVARKLEPHGADQGGWDLTQLLRVPYTANYKRSLQNPWVVSMETNPARYHVADFDECFPVVDEQAIQSELPFPTNLPDITGEQLIQLHITKLSPTTWDLFNETPTGDWSTALWTLTQNLYAAGLSPTEVFLVLKDAKCNKFERDGRSDQALWAYEVVKGYAASIPDSAVAPEFRKLNRKVESSLVNIEILTPEERDRASKQESIITEYVEWGESVMDAPKQYHEAGAFILLSSLLSDVVKLPTIFGTIVPNLWVMILADSTLTRKSSAMDLATELLYEIDEEILLATDGSIEGIMSALANRPSRTSLFLRDEFSGLLESMNRKDYYSGMAEMLTKLYDGKMQKRQLRKETITVTNPRFIVYSGGIRSRILDLFSYSYVYSGFIPRFIFITATTDINRLKPLGPPTHKSMEQRDRILRELTKIHEHYHQVAPIRVGDTIIEPTKQWSVELTPEAWDKYNAIEHHLIQAAIESFNPDLFKPTFSRLANSGLKLAVLVAASKRLEDKVIVDLDDILDAFRYCERWIANAVDVIVNIGRSEIEKQINAVYKSIESEPGIDKAQLMRTHKITARGSNEIFETLTQRGLIFMGRNKGLYVVGTEEDRV